MNHIQRRHTDQMWPYTSNTSGSESSIEDEKQKRRDENRESNKTITSTASACTFDENTSGNS